MIDYLAHKLFEIKMTPLSKMFSDDDEDIE